MASLPPTSGSPETGSKKSPIFLIVGLGAALLAVAAGAFFFLGGESKPKKKTTSVVNIMPVLPPPPPPPPPTPPPPPPDQAEPPPDAPEQAAVFPSREDFDTRDQLFRRLAVALHTVHFKAVGQPGIGEGLFIGFDIVQPQQTDRLAHEIRFLIALVLRFREQLKNFRA